MDGCLIRGNWFAAQTQKVTTLHTHLTLCNKLGVWLFKNCMTCGTNENFLSIFSEQRGAMSLPRRRQFRWGLWSPTMLCAFFMLSLSMRPMLGNVILSSLLAPGTDLFCASVALPKQQMMQKVGLLTLAGRGVSRVGGLGWHPWVLIWSPQVPPDYPKLWLVIFFQTNCLTCQLYHFCYSVE